jgi:hypothetical protein
LIAWGLQGRGSARPSPLAGNNATQVA